MSSLAMSDTSDPPRNMYAVRSYSRMVKDPEKDLEIPAVYQAFHVDSTAGAQPVLLPLTARIGLPLYCFCFTSTFYPEHARLQLIDTAKNPILSYLTMQQSKVSGGFSTKAPENIDSPDVLLFRADGKELTPEHVLSLWVFADNLRQGLEKEMGDISEALRIELFFSQMTPENFVKFWPQYNLKDEECPVKLGCRGCGKLDGMTLSRCGRCGIVKYCGRECQKEDWDGHKKVCKLYAQGRSES